MFACCKLTSFPFSHHYARRPTQAAMLYVVFVFMATTPLVLPSLSWDSRVLVRALPSRRRSRSCSHSHSRFHSRLQSRSRSQPPPLPRVRAKPQPLTPSHLSRILYLETRTFLYNKVCCSICVKRHPQRWDHGIMAVH